MILSALLSLEFLLIPHIFVWGSCFWFCIRPPPARLLLPPPPLTCSHTTCTHTHTTCTQLTHRRPTHTQLARDAAAFCVAGVALCDIDLHFVWQAWHLTTSIVTLRGRQGTYGTGLALAARLVSHGAVTPWRFAWQAWHFVTSAFTLCGRRGT